MRYCCGLPRFKHILRVIPAEIIADAMRQIDNHRHMAILSWIMPEIVAEDPKAAFLGTIRLREQTALPMSMGGLGLATCRDTHAAALIGGWSMASHKEQNISNMFYAFNEEYTLIPDKILRDAGKSLHLTRIAKVQKWLMEYSAYLEEQAKMHTLIHRAFKEGKQTSTSYRKVPVWEVSIEDKRITRPQDLVGMETKENNAHTRFMKELRWGSNGLHSTGKDAEAVYPNLKPQREVLGRGLNKEILGRRNATTCEYGETVWRINGTGYTLNEVLDSTKRTRKQTKRKCRKSSRAN